MRYSQSTELGIESVFYMAAHPEFTDFSVEQVATAQGVSVTYLAKIFQQLVKAGLLRSHRGAKGGYALSRAPAQISLRDIAAVFEGSVPLYDCNANAKNCGLGAKCLIIATFKEAEEKMYEVLERVTLRELVERSLAQAGWIGKEAAAPGALRSEQTREA